MDYLLLQNEGCRYKTGSIRVWKLTGKELGIQDKSFLEELGLGSGGWEIEEAAGFLGSSGHGYLGGKAMGDRGT